LNNITLDKLGDEVLVSRRVSTKAKRISIRITRKGPELVLPKNCDIATGYKFLLSKESWVRQKLKQANEVEKVHADPNLLPFFGKMHRLLYIDSGKRTGQVLIRDDVIEVRNHPLSQNKTLIAFLKDRLLAYIASRVEVLSETHGFRYSRIRITNAKSKWGSCSSKSVLAFNWRLVFAPHEMVEYVIIHELCHTTEMNHSKAFWRLVEGIYPDYKMARLWFKDNGRRLHGYLR
jgi:predicted metal-dependent hydrolase